jgi:hypothetical protein
LCSTGSGEDGLARSPLAMTHVLTDALLGCLPIDLSRQRRTGKHHQRPVERT